MNQKVALRLLDQLGYRADVASNGLEALEALERQPYDVVLMDVQMPELDGLDASRRICERWPAEVRPRIIAMTANAMREDREACFAAGMDDYVAKPIRPNELAMALSRARPLADTRTPRAEGAGASLDASAVESLRDLGGDEFVAEVIDTFLSDAPALVATLRTTYEQRRRGRAASGGAHPEVERPDVRGGTLLRALPRARAASEERRAGRRRRARRSNRARVRRPRADARCAPGDSRVVSASASPPGTILVVDDNRVNSLLLSRGLEQQGHTVVFAEHGREALDLLRSQHFDLMLLDVLMPDLDGYQVLAELKLDPHLRDIPVIMTSSLDELDSVVKCVEMGAEDYLTKPINPVLAQRAHHCEPREEAPSRSAAGADQQVRDEGSRGGSADLGLLARRKASSTRLRCSATSARSRRLSKARDPAETIELLNDYYMLMMDAIGGEGGIVNQMVGDGLMAIFGAPLPRDGHRQRAVLRRTPDGGVDPPVQRGTSSAGQDADPDRYRHRVGAGCGGLHGHAAPSDLYVRGRHRQRRCASRVAYEGREPAHSDRRAHAARRRRHDRRRGTGRAAGEGKDPVDQGVRRPRRLALRGEHASGNATAGSRHACATRAGCNREPANATRVRSERDERARSGFYMPIAWYPAST